MNALAYAQRRFDHELPEPQEDIPDRREEFLEGFASATGHSRATVHDAWLNYVGSCKPQRWVDAQEECGFERGVELGKLAMQEAA